jgi:hypothetical protein
MRYTVEEGGRLNNYAVEPKVTFAEPPTQSQQKGYIIMGSIGAVLVGGLLYVAFAVSQVSS